MLGQAAVIQLSSWHSDQQQLCALAFAEKIQGENCMSLRNRVRTACDCIRDNAIFIPALALVCYL